MYLSQAVPSNLSKYSYIDIIEPNLKNKNKIIGCICKHPNIPVAEFTSDFINLLLEKLSHEKKR